MALITLADVKAHLNMSATATTFDAELTAFISAAVEVVEMLLREVVEARSIAEVHRELTGWGGLLLSSTPVLEVQAVASLDAATTWTPANLLADATTGRVDVTAGPPLVAPLQVTYRAGREDGTYPGRYRMAALMLIAHWWQTQRVPYGGAATRYGGADPSDDVQLVAGWAIPNAVLELLGPTTPMVG